MAVTPTEIGASVATHLELRLEVLFYSKPRASQSHSLYVPRAAKDEGWREGREQPQASALNSLDSDFGRASEFAILSAVRCQGPHRIPPRKTKCLPRVPLW